MKRTDSRRTWTGEALGRLARVLQNAAELREMGELAKPGATPHEVVGSTRVFRLRRYGPPSAGAGPAIVLVPPLMLTAEVYDVSPESSAVGLLLEAGIDPFVVDFGAPEQQAGGLERTLSDHVVAVSEAIDLARKAAGRDVHLGGYSQGGMFCYQAAAYRRSEGLASVITFGSPVDVHRNLPRGVPQEMAESVVQGMGRIAGLLFASGGVPAWMSRLGFQMMSPTKTIQQQLEFLTQLDDRESVRKREAQRRFLGGEGWVAWPGPALEEFIDQFLVHNRMVRGGIVIDGRTIALADITCPILIFVGKVDEIARPATVRSIVPAAPRAAVFEHAMVAGHFGLVVGSKARVESWPTVVRWLRHVDDGAPLPDGVVEATEHRRRVEAPRPDEAEPEALRELGNLILGTIGRIVLDGADRLRSFAENAVVQLPRLYRLDRLRRDTRVSIGLLLAERAESHPRDTFFLFEGRAYDYADANRRVDAVVRGLLSLGIRQGEHVGVLMRTRPTALALVVALNRLGAVSVVLRPDGDLREEIALGDIQHLVADPEHLEPARDAWPDRVLLLGAAAPSRTVPDGVVDMERIDPDEVAPPEWYTPNPGRAGEIAFVLFSGREDSTRKNRISNRRWALSAFGAASGAALSSRDTIYFSTPIHHPTGLLVAVGGALAGGARLAVATDFTPRGFWNDVRRYGVSVVFYAGAMCRHLVDAPADPAERAHPIRLFAGSGMPLPVWRRLVRRLGPVSVLEFYASTEGNAVLANVSGEKIGCAGRPLPGSAEVALAPWDFLHGRIACGEGFCEPVDAGEPGLLLSKVEPEKGSLEGRPWRSVFEAGDAWFSTGDLFEADDDGDLWLVDHVQSLIRSARGQIPSRPIENAFGSLDPVSIAAAVGIRQPDGEYEVPTVFVEIRPEHELHEADLVEAAIGLDAEAFPLDVTIVDALPMTIGHRPLKGPLREPHRWGRSWRITRDGSGIAATPRTEAPSLAEEAR